jgi:D-alanyl-D-alanine carboxypeptidase
VSTGAHPLPHRVRWPHRRVLWVLAGLLVAAGVAVAVDRTVFSGGGQASRPDLQRILDGLVTGPRVAPGATAYVLGPHGSWAGSAGIANVQTGEAMPPDGRMRIQSLSKTWVMAVILQLASEGTLNLDDTVSHWLPGLLPYGDRVTIRELMTDTSGLMDDNDLHRTPTAVAAYLARVKDAKLRAQLAALAARVQGNPAAEVAPIWLIRLAAWQPLLFAPGSEYRHSNIGWNIVGMVAAKAGGKPLPVLYRERIFQPLGLTHTSYQPQGPIAGPHAEGYEIGKDGSLTDATAFTFGKGADGAIVTDAADEAAFLRALFDNQLGIRQQVLDFFGASGGNGPGCPGDAFLSTGAGAASRSYVYYDHTGSHIAVLLLNGFRATTAATGDPKAEAAARRLYCGA